MTSKDDGDRKFVTLSKPESQVIPVCAIKGGQYVNIQSDGFTVGVKGLLRPENNEMVFEGTLEKSDIIFSRFVYVGTLYPDRTCVPFIPIANVEIHSKITNDSNGNSYGVNSSYRARTKTTPVSKVPEIDLTIPSKTWKCLRTKLLKLFAGSIVNIEGVRNGSQETYIDEYGDVQKTKKELESFVVTCKISYEDTVRVCLQGMWFERNIQDALRKVGPLTVNAFLMPKCTRTPSSCTASLSFELYGLWLTESIESVFGPFHWQKIVI